MENGSLFVLAALITLCQARVAHERVRRAAGFHMHTLSSPALRDHRSGGCRRRRGRGGPGAFLTLVKKSKHRPSRAATRSWSCPPREFQEVAGTARGPALAQGAEPRGLGPCEAEPPRAREPRDASCEGVVHEASMRALRAAAYVKKRANCSLAGGGDASTHGLGSPAGAE